MLTYLSSSIWGIAGTDLRETNMPDETWEVRLIKEEFKRLMFEVEDV